MEQPSLNIMDKQLSIINKINFQNQKMLTTRVSLHIKGLSLERMARPTKLFRSCSLLMSCLFAYSSFVQLNDPDWYYWFLLYACGCVVNLLNGTISSKTTIAFAAKLALWLGAVLFVKVVIRDLMSEKTAGLCSLDLTERLVRGKIGSGLVIISMILHLEVSSMSRDSRRRNKNGIARFVDLGMAVLVSFSYGLPFCFFVLQKGEMKF